MKGIYDHVDDEQLKKYATLAVRAGVNVQKNQLVIIHSDIKDATFARLIQTEAYDAEASHVVINWSDEQATKLFFECSGRSYRLHPEWEKTRFKEWDDAGAAHIRIISENLDVFKEVPAERMSRFQKALRTKLKDHYEKTRSHQLRWCLLAVPSFAWATQVFPDLEQEEAIQTLWQLILRGARADGINPIIDWTNHDRVLASRKKYLNDSQFESLHFTNSQGTDLIVGLPNNHIYIGGGVKDSEGITFFPNIPTEEIFTAPHKNKVSGKLVATKPLIYEGSVINDFYLIFEDGRITNYHASIGQKALQRLIETDEGSHYLGEIALVSNHSPLAQTDTLFYNTLFDENTACHIGIGNASPSNLQGGSNRSVTELEEAGSIVPSY
ncbi:LOW QUALITY PROTEIN: aminopeptidase S [Geomicrobium sp. JCM 19037]|nr:LOW QUALITY PROTEIN: aminopeptidase S [Geomicrobium sp. JCM 19037]